MKYIVTPNGKFIGRQKAWAISSAPSPSLKKFIISGYYNPDTWGRAGMWQNPNVTYISGVEDNEIVRTLDSRGFGGRVGTYWRGFGRWNDGGGTMIQTGLDLSGLYVKTELTPHWTGNTGTCYLALCSGYDPSYSIPSEWGGAYNGSKTSAHCPEITGQINQSFTNEWNIPSANTHYDSDNVNSLLSFYQYSTEQQCMWETLNFTASGIIL